MLLELLAESGLSNSTKNRDQENSIQKITPVLDTASSAIKATGNGKISGNNRKVKATSIKLNLLKSLSESS